MPIPRGGAVLHMLRRNLGEENWWRVINCYLRKHAHQPVQTEQFRIAIEETTGQSMEWFFDEWVYRMGHPIFRFAGLRSNRKDPKAYRRAAPASKSRMAVSSGHLLSEEAWKISVPPLRRTT